MGHCSHGANSPHLAKKDTSKDPPKKAFPGSPICGSKVLSKSKIRMCFGKKHQGLFKYKMIFKEIQISIPTQRHQTWSTNQVLQGGTSRRWQRAQKEFLGGVYFYPFPGTQYISG